MKTLSAILLGKTIFKTTRLLKLGGGHAAPGLHALKLDPNLVEKLINHKSKNIIITGTNGKTTTAKLLYHFLKTSGNKVIRNSSGSNLERGIASYLISHANLNGKLDYDFGIWELDEFAFNSVAPKIKPVAIIFLNAFRDQLDRYGEVDTVVTRWQETLKKLSPETLIIANQDDEYILKSIKDFKGKVIKIGVKDKKITGESKSALKSKPDYEAQILKDSDLAETDLKVNWNADSKDFKIPLPGTFNAYNFIASFALAHQMNIDLNQIQDSLKDFTPSFGRFEKFKLNEKESSIFLIKNPVGATQVLQTILPHISKNDSILIALNDNFADGTDVSWIWDITLENFKFEILNFKFYVSGTRAYDMALRLKYAGVNESKMVIIQDLENQFNKAIKETEGKLFVLPTYTALLELQKILVKKGIKKEYWRE